MQVLLPAILHTSEVKPLQLFINHLLLIAAVPIALTVVAAKEPYHYQLQINSNTVIHSSKEGLMVHFKQFQAFYERIQHKLPEKSLA
jgi:hypothetical protein